MIRPALRLAAAAGTVAAITGLTAPLPAFAAPGDPLCDLPQQATSTQPVAGNWWSTRLNASSAWPISRGRAVTVALIDSGVAPRAELAGRVAPGRNFAGDGVPDARRDCIGQGTLAAGMIVAPDSPGSTLPGIAPDALVLPLRVTSDSRDAIDGAVIAAAVNFAVASHAQVISISVKSKANTALAQAVAHAVQAGSVVIAAVPDDAGAGAIYPAAYPGVLAVASTGQDNQSRGTGTPPAGIAAPGTELSGLAVAKGYVNGVSGSAFAAAEVAGVAALVRSRYPDLLPAAVIARLQASADHPARTLPDPLVGWGVVNPYGAVVQRDVAAVPVAPTATMAPVTMPSGAHERHLARGGTSGIVLAAGALGLAALLAGITQARRRGWRPASAPRPEIPTSLP